MKTLDRLMGFGLALGFGAVLTQLQCGSNNGRTPDMATAEPDLAPQPDLAKNPAPTVTTIAPTSGFNNVTTNLTLAGTNFRAGATVSVGGMPCMNPVVVSATSITCTAPSRAMTCGPQDLVVTHPDDGTSGTGARLFSYRSSGVGFATATTQPTGGIPDHIVALDVNKDGKLDLVNTSRMASSIQIHRGVGNGTFMPATNVGTGATPIGMAAVDLNKDTNTDLIVTANGSLSLDIFDGNGTGFAEVRELPLTTNTYGLATGDVNGDGNADALIVAGNSVFVLTGNGIGTLTSASTAEGGPSPYYIAVGDLNNDNKLDFVTSSSSANNVNVVLGKGDGTFGTAAKFAVGGVTNRVVLAEITGDTNLDLIVARSGLNNIGVFAGLGNGTFNPTPVSQPSVGTTPRDLHLVDLNGDGRSDLVVTNSDADTISVLLAQGNGMFAAQQTFGVGTTPFHIASGDFNGDGVIDLAVTNSGGLSLSLLAGQCR